MSLRTDVSMDESFNSMLNTPIKKIEELTLHSPNQGRPIVYPDLCDIPTQRNINESMVNKGYSQTLSTAVLRELDTRANEISTQAFFASTANQNSAMKKKRFSGAHKPMFQKMESISSHYAAARNKDKVTKQTRADPQSSATKKRRTLNGPEEIFGSESVDSSPTRRRESQSPQALLNRGAPLPKLTGSNPFAGSIPSLSAKNPEPSTNTSVSSSPIRSPDLKSSPSKFTRISPSKGSMNLNQLLSDDNTSEFVKPKGPVKVRQTSLQMAGVKPSGSIQSLNKKPSTSSLQKKPSHSALSDRPFSATPKLQSKTSSSSLNKKPSFSTLEKKTSSSCLKKNSQSLNFQAATHLRSGERASPTSTWNSNPEPKQAIARSPTDSSSANDSFCSMSSSRTVSSRSTTAESSDSSFVQKIRPEFKSHTTKAVPFSLYSKPTISSSQKSLDPQHSLQSFPSQRSLSSQASERSLNRFQRFKTRFS